MLLTGSVCLKLPICQLFSMPLIIGRATSMCVGVGSQSFNISSLVYLYLKSFLIFTNMPKTVL